MAWIRSDCSKLSDEWLLYELDGWEYKAFDLFLHRVKAEGARGSVAITSTKVLSRQWAVPEESIMSMLIKAGDRITQRDGRWYVKNWRKFQEDFRDKSSSPENYGDDTEATTITPQDNNPTTTPQEISSNPPIVLGADVVKTKAKPNDVSDVAEYMRNLNVQNPDLEAEKFWDYYASKGWRIGKSNTPIKDWKATVRNWQRNIKEWKGRQDDERAKTVDGGNGRGSAKTITNDDIAATRAYEQQLANRHKQRNET